MKSAGMLNAVGTMGRSKPFYPEVLGLGVTTEKTAARIAIQVDFAASCLEE